MNLAGEESPTHTQIMRTCAKTGVVCVAIAAALMAAKPCLADEIRLKDGKKLYGVIVAYEDNMFKVKTDYGYVLVEKDKIAAIVPNSPAATDSKPASQPAKTDGAPATNPAPATGSTEEVSSKSKIA